MRKKKDLEKRFGIKKFLKNWPFFQKKYTPKTRSYNWPWTARLPAFKTLLNSAQLETIRLIRTKKNVRAERPKSDSGRSRPVPDLEMCAEMLWGAYYDPPDPYPISAHFLGSGRSRAGPNVVPKWPFWQIWACCGQAKNQLKLIFPDFYLHFFVLSYFFWFWCHFLPADTEPRAWLYQRNLVT